MTLLLKSYNLLSLKEKVAKQLVFTVIMFINPFTNSFVKPI